MRHAFLVVTLGIVLDAALTGCSDHGDPVPSPTASVAPSVAVSTPPPVLGPTAAGVVPANALISPADLGAGWSTTAPLATPCAARYARTGFRRVDLAEERGTLSETVSTGTDLEAAVQAWRGSLNACGYDVQDDALGEVGLIALSPAGQDAVVVTGSEGVLVVLHARGGLASATDELDAWADLAFGTSCAATPDGCHIGVG